MIKVTYGNNVDRTSKIVEASLTLREFMEGVGMDYTRGGINVDGASVRPGDLDKSFAELGITERCYLLSVGKPDNAR